ncbi:MAG TPA: Rieske (2Fe-2S) protein [Vicinamibacterales bacterium]|nr:Rieske (2Fe-2S) protein [Vicinamibacterales bacterium]
MSVQGHPKAPAAIERRTFIDTVLGIGFVSTAISFVYPLWRYLIPPAAAEPVTNSVIAGKAAEFKANSGAIVKFGSKPAILIRLPDGQFRAFSAVCTHLDCTVQYRAETSQIWCACHNGLYDLAGNNVSGPPPRPLDAFSVNLRGETGQEEVVISRT